MKEAKIRDALTWVAQEARGLLRAGRIDERHASRLRAAFEQLDAAYKLTDPLSALPEGRALTCKADAGTPNVQEGSMPKTNQITKAQLAAAYTKASDAVRAAEYDHHVSVAQYAALLSAREAAFEAYTACTGETDPAPTLVHGC